MFDICLIYRPAIKFLKRVKSCVYNRLKDNLHFFCEHVKFQLAMNKLLLK